EGTGDRKFQTGKCRSRRGARIGRYSTLEIGGGIQCRRLGRGLFVDQFRGDRHGGQSALPATPRFALADLVGRAVLCPPRGIRVIGAHGVTRPTLNSAQGRDYSSCRYAFSARPVSEQS